MKTALVLASLVISSLTSSSLSFAQEPVPSPVPAANPPPVSAVNPPPAPAANPPSRPGEPDRVISLTWSPLHLVLPMVELTGEFKPRKHVGLAVIGGYGSITDSTTNGSGHIIEAGGQINYYPLRAFAGLDVGLEALYISLDNVNIDSSATAAGLAIGPFVGYKAMFPFGLTLIAQAGVEFVAAKAQNSSTMSSGKNVIPLINLNAGWSF